MLNLLQYCNYIIIVLQIKLMLLLLLLLLRRYVSAANLDLSSSLPFFRSLYFHKATSTYSLRSTGMSYSRTREIVLQAFVELGYPKNLFGLHSLRAGGASAAANAGRLRRLTLHDFIFSMNKL